jgi:hypothetical protein
VPNAADDTFVLRDTDETISGDKTFSGANTHSGASTFSGVTTFTGTRKGDKGADVASEATLFDAAGFPTDGNYFDVTGTTGITAITTSGKVGTEITLHFDGALTITHDGTNIVLPGGNDIHTQADDEYRFIEYSSGDWRCVGGSGLTIFPESSAEDSAGPTIGAGWTELVELNIGTVYTSSLILVTGNVWATKGGVAGNVTISVARKSGTATVRFVHDATSLRQGAYFAAADSVYLNATGIMSVIVSGTLVLKVDGISAGSNSTTAPQDCDIQAVTLKL